MAWTADIPAMGNQLSSDWPATETNFQYISDIGLLQFATGKYSIFQRAAFTYNGGSTAYTVKVGTASYWCVDKHCYWTSELTTNAIGTPSASTWYYLYLDYSAITSGTAITATELIWSSSAPAWNATYRGWYSGNDRCIFAALTNSTPNNILEFFQDGDLLVYADDILEADGVAPSNTWTDVDCVSSLPAFTRKGLGYFLLSYINASQTAVWRTNGQTGTTAHGIGAVASTYPVIANTMPIMTDANQIIEIRWGGATTNTISLKINGWYFPIGM